MIATILAQFPWLARGGIVVVVLLAPLVARWLAPRRRIAWALVVGSAAVIAVLTLFPDDTRTVAGCDLRFSPVELLSVEPLANMVLFLPLVLALSTATRRPVSAFLAGVGVSAAIELLQWGVPAIGRSCTAADWVANSVGAALGATLAALGLLLAQRRGRARQLAR
jgi:VanZ family protein